MPASRPISLLSGINLSLEPQISALRPKFQPQSLNPNHLLPSTGLRLLRGPLYLRSYLEAWFLQAQILALNLNFQSLKSKPHCLKAQIPASRPKSWPLGPNASLKAKIIAFRLESQPRALNLCLEAWIPAWIPITYCYLQDFVSFGAPSNSDPTLRLDSCRPKS